MNLKENVFPDEIDWDNDPSFKGLLAMRKAEWKWRDLVRWLMGIPNIYLHFGDYDFAGINIYMQEYKRHLGARARFFVPTGLELLLARYGNRKLYDIQQLNHGSESIDETELLQVISLLHRYKKGLEQEALIQDQTFV